MASVERLDGEGSGSFVPVEGSSLRMSQNDCEMHASLGCRFLGRNS